jgi:hypothetical protein
MSRKKLTEAGFSDYRTIEANGGTSPQEVSREFYYEMLEVLPPASWTRSPASESFYIIEASTGNLHEWIARLGDKYYALIAPKSSTHEQIINKVKENTKCN